MELHRSKFFENLPNLHFESNRETYRLVKVTEAMAVRLHFKNVPEIYKLHRPTSTSSSSSNRVTRLESPVTSHQSTVTSLPRPSIVLGLSRNSANGQPRSQGTLSTSRKYPGYGWSRVC